MRRDWMISGYSFFSFRGIYCDGRRGILGTVMAMRLLCHLWLSYPGSLNSLVSPLSAPTSKHTLLRTTLSPRTFIDQSLIYLIYPIYSYSYVDSSLPSWTGLVSHRIGLMTSTNSSCTLLALRWCTVFRIRSISLSMGIIAARLVDRLRCRLCKRSAVEL